jgi:hypothetical protein
MGYHQLRNLISHNGGVLDASDAAQKARTFVRNEPGLTTNEEGWVTLSKEFVVDVTCKLQDALLSLEHQLNILMGLAYPADEFDDEDDLAGLP